MSPLVFTCLLLGLAFSEAHSVLIILATGFEELEAIATADILRSAGAEVTLVRLPHHDNSLVTGKNGITVETEKPLPDPTSELSDMIVIPGGPGSAEAMKNSAELKTLLTQYQQKGKFVGAICLGPSVLNHFGLFKQARLTSFPSIAADLAKNYTYVEQRVVVDGRLITSRAPGTATEFALQLVTSLLGKQKADNLAKDMLIRP